jgi:hypothetical protein
VSEAAINVELRRIVAVRAEGLCEYCLIHEDDTVFGCHVDHIISLKHGGPTHAGNLAMACVFCNRAKGSDIGSVLDPDEPTTFVRLFHPRHDAWTEHFVLGEDGVTLLPRTDVGAVTVRLLGFNVAQRLLERAALAAVGRYPSMTARRRLEPQL